MQKIFAAHRCPIKFVQFVRSSCPIKFDMLYSFCYDPLPRWSMGKPAILVFTVLPGNEYVDVHQ